jgi:hypothetical protein
VDGQQSVVAVGLDALGVHGVRKREIALERSVGSFHPQVIVFVDRLLELALAAKGQFVVLDANVDVLLIDVRKIGFHDQLALGLIDVYSGRPVSQSRLTGRVKLAFEQPIHLIVKGAQTLEWSQR